MVDGREITITIWSLGLRPVLALHPPLSPLTHHRDKVTVPHGRPNLRSRLHSCHAQEGGQRSPQRTCGGIRGGGEHTIIWSLYLTDISWHICDVWYLWHTCHNSRTFNCHLMVFFQIPKTNTRFSADPWIYGCNRGKECSNGQHLYTSRTGWCRETCILTLHQ